MPQQYDVPLKSLFMKPGTGIIRTMICGGKALRFLPTEEPKVSNRRADLLVENDKHEIVQIEFQTTNQANYGFRMLKDFTYFTEVHGQEIKQVTLYIGREPMRLEERYRGRRTVHEYTIINLRELEAGPLIESPDWVDNVLAVLAKGDVEVALNAVLEKVRALPKLARQDALGELALISGILKLEDLLQRKVREFEMNIDLRENTLVRPLIDRAEEAGRAKGKAEGRAEGKAEGRAEGKAEGKVAVVRDQLRAKFGRLPKWADARLAKATVDDADEWARKILTADNVEGVIGRK